MHSRAAYIIAVATLLSQSTGELVIAPRDTESKIGDTTYFNCSSNLTSGEIFWYHGLKYIYTGDAILDPYRGRFEIERNSSMGSHNLVIHSVQPSDMGEYICADDDGFGTRRSAELVVLDANPDCQSNIQPDGVIGQNIFKIPPDEVQLTCSVTYNGKILSTIEWTKVGDNSFIKDDVTSNVTSTNRLISTLKLKGDISLDKSSYVCQTTRSAQNQYNCTSEIIKVLYFVGGNTIEKNVIRGEQITCVADNYTFPCSRQWTHVNNSCPLSCDDTITPHLLGEYLCTLKCSIRGVEYVHNVTKVVVFEAATSPLPSTSGKKVVAIVIPICIVVISLLIALIVVGLCYKKNRHEQRNLKTKEKECLVDDAEGGNSDQQEAKNIVEKEIELLHKLTTKGASQETKIKGVTIFDRKLFIVREKSSQLEIYDFNNFNNIPRKIYLKELVEAVDIFSCKKNKCIYILNNKKGATREVIQINTDGGFLTSWPVKSKAFGYLSIAENGNVIITVQDKEMLLEYTPDGKLVCKVKLSKCNNPWHSIKLGEQYLVCHGTMFDKSNRVCLVDKTGTAEKWFGDKIGSSASQLDMPFYMAVGSNGYDRYVLVADLRNNRVLLLDSDLKFKAKLVPKYNQGFRNPRRIHLDESQGLIVVVINEGEPRETMPAESGNSNQRTEDDDTSAAEKIVNERLTYVDVSQQIEQDCRLLVFNIKPLLQQLNPNGNHFTERFE